MGDPEEACLLKDITVGSWKRGRPLRNYGVAGRLSRKSREKKESQNNLLREPEDKEQALRAVSEKGLA